MRRARSTEIPRLTACPRQSVPNRVLSFMRYRPVCQCEHRGPALAPAPASRGRRPDLEYGQISKFLDCATVAASRSSGTRAHASTISPLQELEAVHEVEGAAASIAAESEAIAVQASRPGAAASGPAGD